MEMKEPIRVVVTGAAGQIAYSLLYSISRGQMFGEDQPVNLVLLDIEVMMGVLQGVVMEIQDCALPLVREVIATHDANIAFKDADVAILVGAMPRREGMERKDLLEANVKIFKVQGEAMDKFAKKTIKVLVVGNPANTNAFICAKYAPSIPKENFSALTRLDQNRAKAQVAAKAGVPCSAVKDCIIWGNHSSTQFPDLRHAKVNEISATKVINDDAWVKGEFVTTVQKRGGAVIAARKLSSAMSAANAIVDHMKDWWHGTKGEIVSMAVWSDGNSYGVPVELMYSFPVTIKDRKYTIVEGLDIDDWSKEKMEITAAELADEKRMAMECCQE